MTRLQSYAHNLKAELESRLIPIEGGPMDGVRMLTAADLGLAFEAALMPPVDTHVAELLTPATVYLDALCHICGERARVAVGLESKTTVDDKRRVIAAKVDAGSVNHLCGQLPLNVTPDEPDGQMDWTVGTDGTDGADGAYRVAYVVDILSRVGVVIAPEVVDGWTEPEREEAVSWATAYHVAVEMGEEPVSAPVHVTIVATPPEESEESVNTCPYPGCDLLAEHRGAHKDADGKRLPKGMDLPDSQDEPEGGDLLPE